MIYVALLRGINVGGNNKVDMKELKKGLEQAGMLSVQTYINSGNIVFAEDNHGKEELSPLLEAVILKHFDLDIKVLVYSFNDFQQIAASIPEDWTNDKEMKSDVWFLWDAVDDESVLKNVAIKPEIDRVKYIPGAILWSVDKDQVTKSGISKVVGTRLYKLITVRNVNTVRKLLELMEDMAVKG